MCVCVCVCACSGNLSFVLRACRSRRSLAAEGLECTVRRRISCPRMRWLTLPLAIACVGLTNGCKWEWSLKRHGSDHGCEMDRDREGHANADSSAEHTLTHLLAGFAGFRCQAQSPTDARHSVCGCACRCMLETLGCFVCMVPLGMDAGRLEP